MHPGQEGTDNGISVGDWSDDLCLLSYLVETPPSKNPALLTLYFDPKWRRVPPRHYHRTIPSHALYSNSMMDGFVNLEWDWNGS